MSLACLICRAVDGANPDFNDFNTNQFTVSATGPQPRISLSNTNSSGGSQVWTNSSGVVRPVPTQTYTQVLSQRPILVGSNTVGFLLHHNINAIGLGAVHDQALGENADLHILLESYANLGGDATNSANIDAQVNSTVGSPFVGLQMAYSGPDGSGEVFDFFAEGDVYSQLIFSTSVNSPNDANPLVLAPNYQGEVLNPPTAYKFGSSHVVTNNDLAEFSNAGTNVVRIGPLGQLISMSGLRTNAAALDVDTSDFTLNTYVTNGNRRAWIGASFTLTAAVAGTAAVGLYVDQSASGTFNNLGPKISAGPLASLVGVQQLSTFLSPGARFVFTNLTSGSGATAAIVANTSQYVSQ